MADKINQIVIRNISKEIFEFIKNSKVKFNFKEEKYFNIITISYSEFRKINYKKLKKLEK